MTDRHFDSRSAFKGCALHVQVDYAAAGIFINITTDSEGGDSAPWWQLHGARMAPYLEPLTQVQPHLSPRHLQH